MDLLRTPGIGPLLRWRHARTALQLVLLALAVVVVVHGLFGPQLASTNLATLLTWVHYRGLLVVALLAAGNLFCAGCPFIRVRDWGRRLHRPIRAWPSRLRGKWIAVVLFVLVLFSYELFDLWALPRATAYLILAYFVGALAIDVVFKGASFCKHLCPIGQFNFVASTASPLEVHVRSSSTCTGCRTADCVVGRRAAPASPVMVQRGCELGLFLPGKVGNLDCTFCLDCVHACPHDNIALGTRLPALELVTPDRRSGIGRVIERTDIVVLVIVFVFGGLLNALAMIAPIAEARVWAAEEFGAPEVVVLGLLFVMVLVVLPMGLLWTAAAATRTLSDRALDTVSVIRRFVYGLVPVGFGIWLGHYGFHLLTGALVVVPVTQNAVFDLMGWPVFGQPRWTWTGLRPGAVFPIQAGLVLLGAMGSWAVVRSIAERDLRPRHAAAAWPWGVLILFLTVAALWVMDQPMAMRGLGQ